jgi:tetratricopeptide (TPR) repeat protein
MSRTNLALVLIASVAGAAAGAVTTALLAPAPFTQPIAAAANDARLAELAGAQSRLEQALAELKQSQALLASRPERTSPGVETQNSKPAQGATPEVAVQTPPPAEVAITIETAMAQLCDPEATYAQRTAIWEKVNKAGMLDAVVKSMEERAAREPNNPDVKVDLGNAYLQEVFAASPMSKGKWAMKANDSFDAALELNPEHWEARFTKAVSLSNWPAFLGKQSQAISEFETLIKQQNAGPKKDEHAQTYLYLGNMYQGTGSVAKAIEAWQKGLELFPDNADLKQHIADAKKL